MKCDYCDGSGIVVRYVYNYDRAADGLGQQYAASCAACPVGRVWREVMEVAQGGE